MSASYQLPTTPYNLLIIAGPTASGKSSRGVEEALARNGPNGAPFGGEVISVDSRQVYRGLDIGTEKITAEEMRGVPHHLIDIRDAGETYSAGDFVTDATRLIEEIAARGKLPILVGGTHFYFDALLKGLPGQVAMDPALRAELEKLSDEELFARVSAADPRRASDLDPKNRRRLIRALEIIDSLGSVPSRPAHTPSFGTRSNLVKYDAEWIVMDPEREELRAKIDARLATAVERGLIEEVRRVREELAKPAKGGSPDASQNEDSFRGDTRLNELGLEYKIVGEFLRGERDETSLLPTLSAKLWQYARRQKAWLRKLADEIIPEVPSLPDRS
jgi:tRNA dimethylallyltransferase